MPKNTVPAAGEAMPISRRKALSLMAAVSIPPIAVVGAGPAMAENAGLTALQDLIAKRADAVAADGNAWEICSDIECSPTLPERPMVRVLTSRYYHGCDDEGKEIYTPKYSYDEKSIRQAFQGHLAVMIGRELGTPQDVLRVRKIRDGFEARIQAKIAELEALQAESDRIELEAGLTSAYPVARAASAAVRAIDRSILDHIPQSLGEVVMLARWVRDCRNNEIQFLEDEEVDAALLRILCNAERVA